MALRVTQCPACESTFNTNPGLLAAANGRVRCGACLQVFHAETHFLEVVPDDELESESVFVGPAPHDYFDPSQFVARSLHPEDEDGLPDEVIVKPTFPSLSRLFAGAEFKASGRTADDSAESAEVAEEPDQIQQLVDETPSQPPLPDLYQPERPEDLRLRASFSLTQAPSTAQAKDPELKPEPEYPDAAAESGEETTQVDSADHLSFAPPESSLERDELLDLPGAFVTGQATDDFVEQPMLDAETFEPLSAAEQEKEFSDAVAEGVESTDWPAEQNDAAGEARRETVEGTSDLDISSSSPVENGIEASAGEGPGQGGIAADGRREPADGEMQTLATSPIEPAEAADEEVIEQTQIGIEPPGAAEQAASTRDGAEADPLAVKASIREQLAAAPLTDDDDLEDLTPESLQQLQSMSDSVEIQSGSRSHLLRQAAVFTLCLLLGTSLVIQHLWRMTPLLARADDWRAHYQLACSWIGCSLPPYSNVDAIRSDRLDVRNHPDSDQALQVSIAFRNTADFSQRFPVIILSFNSAQNEVIALREFSPAEYLGPQLSQFDRMPAGTPVQIELAVIDPGPFAANYTLAFRRP